MKILGGIPSRLRRSAGRNADILSVICDEVVVVSQGAIVESNSSKVVILEKPVNFGINPARSCIDQYAVVHNFDIVIESDDDIRYDASVLELMIKELIDNPTLGSCGIFARVDFNWNKQLTSNKNFVLRPHNGCLWAARTSVLSEIGEWKCDGADDIEHGFRMWRHGFAVSNLRKTVDDTFDFVVTVTNDIQESGGFEREDRYDKMWKALDYIGETYPDMVYIGAGNETRRWSPRYNWKGMIQPVIDRFGCVLGYEDSKGRKL